MSDRISILVYGLTNNMLLFYFTEIRVRKINWRYAALVHSSTDRCSFKRSQTLRFSTSETRRLHNGVSGTADVQYRLLLA